MKSKLNISIDDVSPHPRSSIKVVEACKGLIKRFPDIKFSLFIPAAYWRSINCGHKTATSSPLNIDKYDRFCTYLKSLPQNNFELCYHGLFHGIPHKSNNDEFHYLNYEEAIEKFNTMFEITKRAGLYKDFKKIFRPPAWRMSPAALKAARDIGIEILALSPDEYAKKTYEGEDEVGGDVVYYNVNPPFKDLKLFDKTEIVYHACEWDKNHLNKDKVKKLSQFIMHNAEKIDFCFMGEML